MWRTIVDDDFPLPPTPGLASTPPMGWNSWNTFACNVTASDIQQAADQIVARGMKDAGYQYVNIDDCWAQTNRAADGTVQVEPRFSDAGIQPIADYVHARGLKLGLYSDRGSLTCGMRSGSQDRESQDAMSYAAWGVDYLKYDNCFVTKDMKTQYQTMRDALLATGRPMVFSLCSWQFDQWDLTTGQLWRTTSDIGPNWDSLAGAMGSVMQNLTKNKVLAAYAGPNGWNDPDMLEIGKGMSTTEDRAHFTMWAMMAAPLIAGNDLANMTINTAKILTNTEVIAIDQDPLGYQGVPVRIDGDLINTDVEVWAKPLDASGARAVVLLNAGTMPQDITARFTDIGLGSANATVRDLWQHLDLGSFADSYTATVQSHGVVALKVVGTEPAIPIGTGYLSDLTWTYAANGLGPVEKDRSNGGALGLNAKVLSLQGKKYAKGLGVASGSMIVYRLGRVCTMFTADIGIDDETGGRGSVDFQVWTDGEMRFDSGTMTATAPVQRVQVDLIGRRRLKLVVVGANDGPTGNRGDWADATIVCP
ncbi:MAG: NPCBM/NEW2 domain-containing protein [Myxococcota bacterium]|nr:NPCBM/NEW2 domain-containing protein [Myxococcota bacterium]